MMIDWEALMSEASKLTNEPAKFRLEGIRAFPARQRGFFGNIPRKPA
jgi:hypothetical protein